MKTITECQPMIYSLLMARAERRRMRRRRNAQVLKTIMPMLYALIGLAIVFDAGIVPWDISFWLIFSPFFLFGESVLSAVARGNSRILATTPVLSSGSK
jgi:hypothetical protein